MRKDLHLLEGAMLECAVPLGLVEWRCAAASGVWGGDSAQVAVVCDVANPVVLSARSFRTSVVAVRATGVLGRPSGSSGKRDRGRCWW